MENNIARRETEIPMVVNAAVHYLRERKFELPARSKLNSIADIAIKQATECFIDMINEGLSRDEQKRLESLIALFQRRIKAKTNPERKSPRKYTLVYLK